MQNEVQKTKANINKLKKHNPKRDELPFLESPHRGVSLIFRICSIIHERESFLHQEINDSSKFLF